MDTHDDRSPPIACRSRAPSGCRCVAARDRARRAGADATSTRHDATDTRTSRSSRTPRTASPATTTWSTPVGRGRLDRRDLAIDDDGELGARSVLAGRRAARDDRPPDARGGDPGRMRRVPHADGAADRARGGRQRARCSRTCRSRARPIRRCIGSPPTASRARSVTRSRDERSARARASTASS